MKITERQLSDVLHRVTPEPPRGVTVEDVAIRLANQAGHREPRPRRGSRSWAGGRTWAPALAAASVFVIAGASAGIAVLASSHHGPSSPAVGASSSTPAQSGSPSSTPAQTPAATQTPASTSPAVPIPNGPWAAELVTSEVFMQNSLVSDGGSLYAIEAGGLVRIDPVTGTIAQTVPYNAPIPNPPVVLGNTVWVVSAYSGGSIVLHGYDARTLAQVASYAVPAIGQVSATAQGVLAAGPDGHLYLAAGDTVAVVNPATGQVIKRIFLASGAPPASSVAVSPDGTKLYIAAAAAGSFWLRTYDLASGLTVASSSLSTDGTGGNLIATSGGVWGTLGTGMTEFVWFAPNGDLSQSVRIGQGAGAGLASVPTLSGGAVWIGGSHTLACASPATGQVLASQTIPTDNSIVEYFGSVAVVGGHAYAYYQNQAAQRFGVARMTPPAACTRGGGGS